MLNSAMLGVSVILEQQCRQILYKAKMYEPSVRKSLDSRINVAYLRNMQRYTTPHNASRYAVELGTYLRQRRTELAREDKGFSLRQVAGRCGVTPAYFSRVERGEVGPPSEKTLLKLAAELHVDSDVLLALAGKVSTDLRAVIVARPKIFADLIRQLKDAPDDAVLRVVREINDGDW